MLCFHFWADFFNPSMNITSMLPYSISPVFYAFSLCFLIAHIYCVTVLKLMLYIYIYIYICWYTALHYESEAKLLQSALHTHYNYERHIFIMMMIHILVFIMFNIILIIIFIYYFIQTLLFFTFFYHVMCCLLLFSISLVINVMLVIWQSLVFSRLLLDYTYCVHFYYVSNFVVFLFQIFSAVQRCVARVFCSTH